MTRARYQVWRLVRGNTRPILVAELSSRSAARRRVVDELRRVGGTYCVERVTARTRAVVLKASARARHPFTREQPSPPARREPA